MLLRMTRSPAIPTLVSCIAAGSLAAFTALAAPGQAALQLKDCGFDHILGGTASARCGRMQVPESRDDPTSRTLSLRITVIPSMRLQPEPDPLVVISGGPGQSATDFYVSAGAAFAAIR